MTFETVEPVFVRLRDYVLRDVAKITDQAVGGNYAATAVVVCACDALGNLTYGAENTGARFFSEFVLPEKWRLVGGSIYSALRHGLVHLYETKSIRIGGRTIELSVSWKERPHLTFNEDRTILFVNVQTMRAEMEGAFERIRQKLLEEAAFRYEFYMRSKAGTVLDARPGDVDAWKALLSE